MLALNERVHYGNDLALRQEFATAIESNADKCNLLIAPITGWYSRHADRGEHPLKLAAETYVSIVGQPQLFIEGNDRTGSLIASWINRLCALCPIRTEPRRVARAIGGDQTVRQPLHLARTQAVAKISQVVSSLLGNQHRRTVRSSQLVNGTAGRRDGRRLSSCPQ